MLVYTLHICYIHRYMTVIVINILVCILAGVPILTYGLGLTGSCTYEDKPRTSNHSITGYNKSPKLSSYYGAHEPSIHKSLSIGNSESQVKKDRDHKGAVGYGPQSFTVNENWCFQCQRCSFTSHTKIELDRHIHWSHSGTKPYKCSLCSFTCAYSHVLKRHMLTHTGEKPHQCKLCSKRFARSDSVLKHMETHSPRRNRLTETTGRVAGRHGRLVPHLLDSKLYRVGKPAKMLSIAGDYRQQSPLSQLIRPESQALPCLTISNELKQQRAAAETDSQPSDDRCRSPPPLTDNRPVFPQRISSFDLDANEENIDNQ